MLLAFDVDLCESADAPLPDTPWRDAR